MNGLLSTISDTTIELDRQQIQQHMSELDEALKQPGLEQLIHLFLAPKILDHWLQQFPIQIPYDYSNHSLQNPIQGLVTEFITGLQLGELKLCLLVSDRIELDILEIPEVAVHHPSFASHIYLFLYVPGEALLSPYNTQDVTDQATTEFSILGFIRHDQIIQKKKGVEYYSPSHYEIPQISLDPSFNNLKTCACFIPPDEILQSASAQVDPRVQSLKILEKKIKDFSRSSTFSERYPWQDLKLTPAETDLFFSKKKLQRSLADIILEHSLQQQKTVLSSIQKNIVNLYHWVLKEASNLVEQTEQLLTPYEFVGTFYDAPTTGNLGINFSVYQLKERVRQLMGEDVLTNDAKLMIYQVPLDTQTLNLLIGTWIDSESQAEGYWNLLLILAANSPIGFAQEISIEVSNNFQDSNSTQIDPSEADHLLLLDLTMEEEIELSICSEKTSYKKKFIFARDEQNLNS